MTRSAKNTSKVVIREEPSWGKSTVVTRAGGNGIVIVSILGKERNVAIIHDLLVHGGLRREGIGSQLLEDALDEAREMGANTARLTVTSGSWMENWYERRGFHLVGMQSAYGVLYSTMEKYITRRDDD